jgi:hypothetical protein
MGACINHPETIERAKQLKRSQTKFTRGEQYFLHHKELEKLRGNIAGGKERVELILSLKNDNRKNINITFDVGISSAVHKDLINKLGNTGTIEELHYPTTFIVDYLFECNQHLYFDVKYDGLKLDTIKTTLGQVFGSRGHSREFPFTTGSGEEHVLVVSIHAVKPEVESNNISFKIRLNGNMGGNYFVVISNSNIPNSWTKVYKSNEHSGSEINTNQIILNDVCKGNTNQPIKFEIHEASKGLIDTIQTDLDHCNGSEVFALKNIGSCTISYDITKTQQFVDYLEQGLQISVITGIDYTASNGDPYQVRSLHYCGGSEPNNYEQAIRQCGSIVAYYDYDNLFPVYGFGAIMPGESKVNHCFNATLNTDPNVQGVEGIITSYKTSLSNVKLDGPTFFSPLLKNMVEFVRENNDASQSSVYYILMILTDGTIHDMQQTKDVIYDASYLPISLIIIGLGEADFTLMEELDGDTVPLKNSKGKAVDRDIVQFVKFNSFKYDLTMLSNEVLAEVPRQVQQYYGKYKNFKAYK